MKTAEDPYRFLAGAYDFFVGPALQRVRNHCLDFVPPSAGTPVLDIACGTGLFLSDIARRYPRHRLHGIDMSRSMLERAVRKPYDTSILWIRGDGGQSPFPSETFAIVTVIYALHEMEPASRIRVLREAGRILWKTGWLLAVDYDVESLRGAGWKRVSSWGTHLVERIAGRDHYRRFRHFLKHDGLTPLVEGAGFSVIESRHIEGQQARMVLARKRTV